LSVFGKRDDPTASWPANGAAPTLDLDRQSVGPLVLGDRFEGAEALGRPKRVRGSLDDGNFTLEYPAFDLEFHRGVLVCVKFDIDEGTSASCAGDIRLSLATKPIDAQVWFGEPASDSTGGAGLRWIDFERGGATLALEFTGERLTCVQLYGEGYA
jgi:hypothetical protein